jgi:hypothetical protein
LFDACHAETMLDLPHRACNRVVAIGFVLKFVVVQRLRRAVTKKRRAFSWPLPRSPLNTTTLRLGTPAPAVNPHTSPLQDERPSACYSSVSSIPFLGLSTVTRGKIRIKSAPSSPVASKRNLRGGICEAIYASAPGPHVARV